LTSPVCPPEVTVGKTTL